MKYVRVARSDGVGSYIQDGKNLPGMIQGELDGLQDMDVGTRIVLTVVEMTEDEYRMLPEFMGW